MFLPNAGNPSQAGHRGRTAPTLLVRALRTDYHERRPVTRLFKLKTAISRAKPFIVWPHKENPAIRKCFLLVCPFVAHRLTLLGWLGKSFCYFVIRHMAEAGQQIPDGARQRLVAQVRVMPGCNARVRMAQQLGNGQQVRACLGKNGSIGVTQFVK